MEKENESAIRDELSLSINNLMRAEMESIRDYVVLVNETMEVLLEHDPELEVVKPKRWQEYNVSQWFLVPENVHNDLREAKEITATNGELFFWGSIEYGIAIELRAAIKMICLANAMRGIHERIFAHGHRSEVRVKKRSVSIIIDGEKAIYTNLAGWVDIRGKKDVLSKVFLKKSS